LKISSGGRFSVSSSKRPPGLGRWFHNELVFTIFPGKVFTPLDLIQPTLDISQVFRGEVFIPHLLIEAICIDS
jgi:hypothetical protein